MQLAGMDIVLLTTHADIYYFTGFLTQFWQSPTRPWFVLLPQTGKPVSVIPTIGVEYMQRTWVSDIRSWSSPNATDDGVRLLCSTIKELAGDGASIGVPMDSGTHVRMPLHSIEQLQQSFPRTNWRDATALLNDVRAIKSEAEINKIRFSCSVASKAFSQVPGYDLVARNELDLFRQFKMDCLRLGADDCAYLVGASGTDGYTDVISPPGQRQLVKGDVFILDTGCVWDGYYCDFDRNFAVGETSSLAATVYSQLWEATERGIEAVKPGMSCLELHQAMMAALPGTDGGSVGRIGHGLGIELTEPPSLTNFETTELKEGMVITLEPGLSYGNGLTMVHEENLVVRASGAELLSTRASPTMPVCQRI